MINELKTQVLEILSKSPNPININEISKRLGIKSNTSDYFILKDCLNELVETDLVDKLPRRQYALKDYENFSVLKGTIYIYGGKAIVETENPDFLKIIIKRNQLFTALHGDKVEVQLLAQKPGKKPRGEVIKVLERNQTNIVGSLEFDGSFYFLVPDEEFHYVDFLIPKKCLSNAQPGDKVIAKLLQWENPAKSPQAEVVEIIGRAGDLSTEFDAIVKEFDLSETFPSDVMKEATKLSVPSQSDFKNRLDLSDELIITIDPEDAKDFDDALSLKILDNGNYELGVHIADVSYYVTENSEIDIEARFRGNSTYLVDRVIPMLPEKLSNEICSLMPDVPRLAFSVFMEIGKLGAVKDYKIAETVICSKRRYSYDEVQQIIDTGEGDNSDLILQLHQLSENLRKRRFRSGGIDFQTSEVKFSLDKNKVPVDIKLKTTTPATSLVEECMLICNKVIAEHINKISNKYKFTAKLPFLYRIHDIPDPKRLEEVFEFLSRFGPRIKAKNPSSKDINTILASFNNKPEKDIVNQILIRSMAKAIYSQYNEGHFGLGFKFYTHFTSPIRRYPDLIVHRLIKEYEKSKPENERVDFLKIFVKDIAKKTSDTERLSMEAERASIKLAHSISAKNNIGEEFEGTISGVTGFGIYVILDNIYAEGLVHIKDLKDDYYVFDDKNLRLIGRRHKRTFSFGDRIKVQIARVNLKKRLIDFVFVDE